jgi:simple sugar transport system substrate-binding protein
MRRHLRLLLALLLAAGCGRAPGGEVRGAARDSLRIVFVTHGQSADPFWSVVVNGARAAARDLGVDVQYQAPASFDMIEQANLIRATTAARPHGLVVSIPDPDALGPAIAAALAAGIPVLSINSGADVYRELGVLAHVGQTEYEAGYAGGERLAAAGVRRALCINHEVGNTAQDQRCRGLTDALVLGRRGSDSASERSRPEAARPEERALGRRGSDSASGRGRRRRRERRGNNVVVLGVDLADPDDAQRIAGALRSDAAIDGMLALGPAGADPALAALRATGRAAPCPSAPSMTPRVLRR